MLWIRIWFVSAFSHCEYLVLYSYVVTMFCVFLFFFFKQKTAYEMRISDWSSDVCSSDLDAFLKRVMQVIDENMANEQFSVEQLGREVGMSRSQIHKIGRASCRERACQYV